MEKRYSIVRVDNYCPDLFEKINSKFVCEINKDFEPICKNCRYGDTKEQLIKKVAQTRFKQEIKEWYEHFEEKPNKTIVNCFWKRCLKQAKEIIEFLGIEQ